MAFNLETIYDKASFNINDFDKVGIVGANGAGKTTLFNVLLGNIVLDSGKIYIKNKSIGYLPQQLCIAKDELVLDYLLNARPIKKYEKEISDMYMEIASLTDINKQNKLLKEIAKRESLLDYYDRYNYENILFDLLCNMHIDYECLDKNIGTLSGGEKSRIAFLHLLFSKCEILLLDEPTNHLDSKTRDFIINYLKSYKGMVLVISHDTAFLDSIVDKIMYIDIASKKINMYNGNYTMFQKKLAKEKEIKERLIDKQEKEEQRLRDFVLQYSNSSGKRKRIAQSREKLLEKKLLDKVERDQTVKKVNLKMQVAVDNAKIPLKVNNLMFGYKENIINNLSFNINRSERFLIVGNNGVGKSTLLKLIVGKLHPQSGSIWKSNKLNFAYYAQEEENLDMEKSVFENVDHEGYSPNQIRNMLGNFLFHGDVVFKKLKYLSPGQRARVSLCKLLLEEANMLLLDEPTNHLDPQTQEIIANNFKNYGGSIILVSHNKNFVKNIGINRMLLMPSGKIMNYDDKLFDNIIDAEK